MVRESNRTTFAMSRWRARLCLLAAEAVFAATMQSVCLAQIIPDDLHEQLEAIRREEARDELERVRKQKKEIQERITRAREIAYSVYGYESLEVAAKPKSRTTYLDRLEHNKQALSHKLLNHPEKSRAEIVNGRALNLFLDVCGPVAFEMEFYRQLSEQRNQGAYSNRPGELQSALDEFGILDLLTENALVDEHTINSILFKQGLSGSKLTGRLGQGPLDLTWPYLLRKDEYTEDREQLEYLKKAAMKDLKSGRPVDSRIADQLLSSTEELLRRIESEKREALNDERRKNIHIYITARNHAKLLFAGAKRFIEAREIKDVQPEDFEGGNVEQLLAFMHRNQYHFAPAGPNEQTAYQNLFTLMVRYYTRLHSLKDTIRDLDKPLAELNEKENKLMDVKLGLSLSNMDYVQLGTAGFEAIAEGSKAIQRVYE